MNDIDDSIDNNIRSALRDADAVTMMSEMPERIFADAGAYWQKNVSESKYQHEFTEYIRADLAAERIEELEDKLFALGAMERPPCFCCGYNGPGYYNSKMHPCAKRHHELKEQGNE